MTSQPDDVAPVVMLNGWVLLERAQLEPATAIQDHSSAVGGGPDRVDC